MKVTPVKTRVFREGDNLSAFIETHVRALKEGAILAVTSKIVALAEGRAVIVKNEKEREALIRSESESAQRSKLVWLTMKDGLPMANAGMDESNVDPVRGVASNGASRKVVLLPKDSFASAKRLRSSLLQNYKIRKLGVIISDSHVMPMRAGVVGVALGYAGFRGLRDYRGKKDIFGRTLKFTQTDIADSLATAAVLVMGEGKEQQPLCVIEDAPVVFTGKVERNELVIAPKDDMYVPLFSGRLKIDGRRKRR